MLFNLTLTSKNIFLPQNLHLTSKIYFPSIKPRPNLKKHHFTIWKITFPGSPWNSLAPWTSSSTPTTRRSASFRWKVVSAEVGKVSDELAKCNTCVPVSHTTDEMIFQWDPDVPLVVDENIELPQLRLVKNYTADCTQVYSTGTPNSRHNSLYSPNKEFFQPLDNLWCEMGLLELLVKGVDCFAFGGMFSDVGNYLGGETGCAVKLYCTL